MALFGTIIPSDAQGGFSFRNKIINGNFDIWQRGTSLTFSSTGQFIADRWRMGGVSITASQQTFSVGQTEVPGNPRYYFRYVVGASSQNYEMQQLIEDVRVLAGQQVVVTYWARRTSGTVSIGPRLVQDFGTGGSPSSVVIASITQVGSQTMSSSWQKFTYTATMPSISGKTIGTNNDNSTWLSFQIGDTNTGTLEFAQIQVEIGSVATPFEVRPVGVELQLCQRYYQRNLNPTYAGIGTASSAVVIPRFSVVMRVAPTVSALTTANIDIFGTGSNLASSTTLDTITTTGFRVYYGGMSGSTFGQPGHLINDALQATAEL